MDEFMRNLDSWIDDSDHWVIGDGWEMLLFLPITLYFAVVGIVLSILRFFARKLGLWVPVATLSVVLICIGTFPLSLLWILAVDRGYHRSY